MKIKYLLLYSTLITVLITSCNSDDKKTSTNTKQLSQQIVPKTLDSLVEYSAADFRDVENRVNLSLRYTWSYEATGDEHKAFYTPTDLDIAGNGEIFIVDSRNSRIQVFDSSRTYLCTIGRQGEGPGEFLYPEQVLCLPQNRIMVSDPNHGRYQIFDQHGTFLWSFPRTSWVAVVDAVKENMLVYTDSRLSGNPEHSMFRMGDFSGNLLRGVGQHKHVNDSSAYALEPFASAVDPAQNQLFAGYGKHNLIERYNFSGELLQTIYFESLAKKIPEYSLMDMVSDSGYLYAVVLNRPMSENEKTLGQVIVTGDGVNWNYVFDAFPGVESAETDLYRLLVFDQWGRLLSNNLLTKYVDRIRVHDNTLYLIDSFVGGAIYEYKLYLPAAV